jgi:hypothetical protein
MQACSNIYTRLYGQPHASAGVKLRGLWHSAEGWPAVLPWRKGCSFFLRGPGAMQPAAQCTLAMNPKMAAIIPTPHTNTYAPGGP